MLHPLLEEAGDGALGAADRPVQQQDPALGPVPVRGALEDVDQVVQGPVEPEDRVLALAHRVVEEAVADPLLLVDQRPPRSRARGSCRRPADRRSGSPSGRGGRCRDSRRSSRASASSGNPSGSGGRRSGRSDPIRVAGMVGIPPERWIPSGGAHVGEGAGRGQRLAAGARWAPAPRVEAWPDCQADSERAKVRGSDAIPPATSSAGEAGPARVWAMRPSAAGAGPSPSGAVRRADWPHYTPGPLRRVKRTGPRSSRPRPGPVPSGPGRLGAGSRGPDQARDGTAPASASASAGTAAGLAIGSDRSPSSIKTASRIRPTGKVA